MTQRTPAILTLCLAIPGAAFGQSIPFTLTDEQLARPVIVRHDGAPRPVRGRIARLLDDRVILDVAGARIDVPFASVQRIDFAGDSLANGALIGALVFGIWCAKVCGQGADNQSQAEFARVMGFGLGALIGAGIDARTGRKAPIYVRAPGGSAHVGFGIRF